MEVSIAGIIGLYGGMICGILGWWFGRKKAKKNRGLDELYYHIWNNAKSYAWYVTLGAIYIFFSLYLFGIELSTAMLLGILLIVHLGSWAIIGTILSINMTSTVSFKSSRVKLGIIVMAASIIVFTIISIMMHNWLFLLVSIPPNIIGLFTALTPKREESEYTY